MKNFPLKPEIYYRLFEDFPGYLAILDEKGNILATNQFWQRSALQKGLIIRADGVGYNYLKLCEAAEGDEKEFAEQIKNGLLMVLKKKAPFFSLIYEVSEADKPLKKFLFLFFPLRSKPRIFVLLHQEIPEKEGPFPSMETTEGERPLPSFLTGWFSLVRGVLHPFLNLLRNRLEPELEKVRTEVLTRLEEFEKNSLATLHPLAMLTTKEAQIALLVREGKTSEEIAQLLNLGKDAVDFYRKRIREKLGLKGKNISLKDYLQNLFNFSSKA
jgi:DNA-binding CsgD family transcriptional regulator